MERLRESERQFREEKVVEKTMEELEARDITMLTEKEPGVPALIMERRNTLS